MALSNEERDRINEEERMRFEAQEKLKKEASAARTKKGCLGCLGLIGIIVVIAIIIGVASTALPRRLWAYQLAHRRRHLARCSTCKASGVFWTTFLSPSSDR